MVIILNGLKIVRSQNTKDSKNELKRNFAKIVNLGFSLFGFSFSFFMHAYRIINVVQIFFETVVASDAVSETGRDIKLPGDEPLSI